MRPRKPASTPQPDLFRETLAAILDPRHELLRLARTIDWERLMGSTAPRSLITSGGLAFPPG